MTGWGGAGFRIGPPETGRREPFRAPAALGALLSAVACTTMACAAAPPPPPGAPVADRPVTDGPAMDGPVTDGPVAGGDGPAHPVTRVADLVLPFDAYRPTPGQRALMARARAALLARCMHRRGHAVSPPRPDAAAVAAGDPGNSRRYGVADPGRARRRGYHLPPSAPSGTAWDSGLSRSARRDLDGAPGHPGCAERVTTELSGPDPAPAAADPVTGALRESAARATATDWQWLALQDARTVEQAARHPAVVEAAARWSACMERAGHPYPSPEAAIADPRWDLRSDAVTAPERRTATADTACKWSSGLVSAWYAADAAAQRAVIAAEPARFAALRDDLRARLARAADLTADVTGDLTGDLTSAVLER
ncbi:MULTISPECIES: hypothetical protein [unclassified Nonomuraea]|uniref:hypothetical protein n=1 Tax=unclassified Nonomuraea TaxID=2593643 RepID=UPI0033E19DC9